MPHTAAPTHHEMFEAQRSRLLALAWRMLGSRHDAQDLVQDLWLAWREVDLAGLAQPMGYLMRMATHLCIDRLRSAQRQREHYVGVWLPEPWMEAALPPHEYAAPPPADRLMFAQSVSMAFLLVLEVLSPLERAAFLLHDVFDEPFDAVAEQLGRSPVACRQLAARARARLKAAGQVPEPTQPALDAAGLAKRSAELLQAFAQAVGSGDSAGLAQLLSEDVQLLSDGGGVVTAIPRPIRGSQEVARVLCGLAQAWLRGGDLAHALQWVHINGMPGAVALDAAGGISMALALQLSSDGRVCGVYFQRNPHKLHTVADVAGAAMVG